jgi:hypothetical protein
LGPQRRLGVLQQSGVQELTATTTKMPSTPPWKSVADIDSARGDEALAWGGFKVVHIRTTFG